MPGDRVSSAGSRKSASRISSAGSQKSIPGACVECEGFFISSIELIGLPDSDRTMGEGCADPCAPPRARAHILPFRLSEHLPRSTCRYVILILKSASGAPIASVRTPTLPNTRNAKWVDEYMLAAPEGSSFSTGKLCSVIMDEDHVHGNDGELGRHVADLGPNGLLVDRATVRPINPVFYPFQLSWECRPVSREQMAAHRARLAEKAAAAEAAEAERRAAEEREAAAAAAADAARREEARLREEEAARIQAVAVRLTRLQTMLARAVAGSMRAADVAEAEAAKALTVGEDKVRP